MKIFISYRRDDSAGYAGRLFDHLTARFRAQSVFMDIATIRPGQDFRATIDKAVGACDVVLVMIGKHWLSITDSEGQRRLDNPQDLVRAEVASALANPRVVVIPVLVRDASMPGGHELPDDLKELAWRNAIELSDNRFQFDANKLIEEIGQLGVQTSRPSSRLAAGKFWGIILGLFVLGLIIWMIGSGVIPLTAFNTSTPTHEPPSTPTSTQVPPTSSPTAEVVLTAENTLSPAIQTMDQYYKYINNAAIQDDLTRAWDLMTADLQCNPSDNCEVEHYKGFWWDFQVQYELYDCDSNIVSAKLIFYTRGSVPNLSREPEFVTYELINDNGQLKLNTGTKVTGISAYCEFAVASPVAPVITEILTSKNGSAPNQVVYADINFYDRDGDSYIVHYELIDTTISSSDILRYEDDQISTSKDRQINGTVFRVPWNCEGSGYTATFNVMILDIAGNQSNKVLVTFDCR